MQIKIKDFGKIKNADIELSGLTLIAGPNDSGKSTVGKCLFALIKSIASYPQYYNQIVNEQLYTEFLNPLRLELRGRRRVERHWFLPQLESIQDINYSKKIEESFTILYSELKNEEIDKKIEKLNAFKKVLDEDKNTSAAQETLKKACAFLAKYDTSKEKIEFICRRIFKDVFDGNLNNSLHYKDESNIQYILHDEEIITFNIKNNDINVTSFNENAISLSDATFIDNPLLFEQKENTETIKKPYFLRDSDDGINIVSDILNKKKIAAKRFNSENYYEDLFVDFRNIFQDAKFSYNSQDERLKYKVSEKALEIELSNMASGGKSFGLLYTLLKSGVLTKDSLLILDEPENHLHPEWQLKYAQIICKMVKKGFHILITSHSPYMIQALHTYSVFENIFVDKVNFYYARSGAKENYNEIISVRDKNGKFDDSEIFRSLYTPFETLRKIDMQISEKIEKEYFNKK